MSYYYFIIIIFIIGITVFLRKAIPATLMTRLEGGNWFFFTFRDARNPKNMILKIRQNGYYYMCMYVNQILSRWYLQKDLLDLFEMTYSD